MPSTFYSIKFVFTKFLCGISIILLSGSLPFFALSQEQDSVFDLITECDLLAAHPFDPMRLADGVDDDDIVPRLAIMACEAAIENEPDNPQYIFQLARAHLALGREQQAKILFENASQQNYAAAHAYLGDMYQFGIGVSANSDKAKAYYEKARQGEFLGADDQIKQLTFDGSIFVGKMISNVYNNVYKPIEESTNNLRRNYTFNVVITFMDACGAILEPGSLARFYLFRFPGANWSEEEDSDVMVAVQTSVGEYDAEIFLERYGCDGPVAKKVFKNINEAFATFQPNVG